MTGLKRTPIRRVSARKRREIRESRPVVEQVFGRDGGCVLATRTDVAGECFGELTPHHIVKQSRKSGLWVPENLVSLCSHHNGTWVEGNRRAAEAMGLVVRERWQLHQAWRDMRAAGLAVGVLRLPCDGPNTTPLHKREIAAGEAACEACSHFQPILTHPDGGTGPVLAPHQVSW